MEIILIAMANGPLLKRETLMRLLKKLNTMLTISFGRNNKFRRQEESQKGCGRGTLKLVFENQNLSFLP